MANSVSRTRRKPSRARSRTKTKRLRASSVKTRTRSKKCSTRRSSSAKTSRSKKSAAQHHHSSIKKTTRRPASSTKKKKNRSKTKQRASSARNTKRKRTGSRQKVRRKSGKRAPKRRKLIRRKRAPKRRQIARQVTKTPKPARRKRRQSRTGADSRRLKPKKSRARTSGPVEINQYTYNVLYGQFLDEFLPKLSKENGVKVDKRSCRVMRNIFDPPTLTDEQYEVQPSPTMLRKAQESVLCEIERQEKQSKRGDRTGRRSGMERMFYLATGEEELAVDFEMMRKLVRQARLCKFTGDDIHDMGYMDPNINRIKINSGHKMTMYDIKVTLMHEAMHNTVKRSGRPGNPEISEATEHLAMALCGDPDEFTVLLAEPKLDDIPSDSDVDSDYQGDCVWDNSAVDSDDEYERVMSDERYYQKYLQHIEALGFDIDDIPDICSPQSGKVLSRAQSVNPRIGMYASPAKCVGTLYTPDVSPGLLQRCHTI